MPFSHNEVTKDMSSSFTKPNSAGTPTFEKPYNQNTLSFGTEFYQNEEVGTRGRRPYLSNGFDSFHDILDYAHANNIKFHDLMGDLCYANYTGAQSKFNKDIISRVENLRMSKEDTVNFLKELQALSPLNIYRGSSDIFTSIDEHFETDATHLIFTIHDDKFRGFAKVEVQIVTLTTLDGKETTKVYDTCWKQFNKASDDVQKWVSILDKYKQECSGDYVDATKQYKRHYETRELRSITMGPDGPNYDFHNSDINTDQDALPEFYPWLKADMGEYFEEFLKSDSSVLLLIGPPGTGKSTFIRSMINYSRVNATLCYNERTMFDENFLGAFKQSNSYRTREKHYQEKWSKLTGFVNAISLVAPREESCIVLEDSDRYIASRSTGNIAMASLLNHINGVVSNSRTKFIFSTNLDSIDSIDSALLRPGRCFDILPFRKLTYAEGVAIRKAMKFEDPEFNADGKSAFTLAEVIKNIGAHVSETNTVKPRFGFN